MRRRAVISAVIGLTALAAVARPSRAQVQPRTTPLKCRDHIGSSVQGLVGRGLRFVDECYAERSSPLPCNQVQVLRPAPLPSAPTGFLRAQVFAGGIQNVWCAKQGEILANYPAAVPAGSFINLVGPQVQALINGSATTLQGPALPAGPAAKRRCIRSIGKQRTKIVKQILAQAVDCQRAIDRTATSFGIISQTCLGPAPKANKRAHAIARACRGLTGSDVGSCTPLPDCVIASATQTGHDLAVATYGARPDQQGQLCGNGVVDPGETCDDGPANSPTGACTDACRKAACGDGRVEAGVEECDPGSQKGTTTPITDNPDCNSDCKFTTCGDGVIQKGGTRRPDEQCDDGNTVAGDGCSPTCQFETVSCPAGGTIDVTVTFVSTTSTQISTNIAGVQLSVAYPTSVSFPGSDDLPVEDPTDPASRLILLGGPDNNIYATGALVSFFDSGTFIGTVVAGGTLDGTTGFLLLTVGEIPFERIRFDCVSDAELSAANFPCTYQGMTTGLGRNVAPEQRPVCKITLAR